MLKAVNIFSRVVISVLLVLGSACEPKKMSSEDSSGEAASVSGQNTLGKFFPDSVLLPAADTVADDTSGSNSGADEVRVTKLEIYPARIELVTGTTITLRATAVFSDGAKKTVTADGLWSSADNVVGRFDKAVSKNTLIAVDKGSCDISFTYEGIEIKAPLTVTAKTLQTIEIEPKIMLLGENTHFSAVAIYTDDSLQEITSDVKWQSQNTDIATVIFENNQTIVRGIKVGNFSMTAMYQGFSGQNQVKVLMPDIASIAIETETTTIMYGTRPSFKAIATLKSGNIIEVTSSVTWACDNASMCDFSTASHEAGTATINSAGATTVTATFGSSVGSVDITVTNTNFVSYSIEPANADIPINLPIQFKAFGHASDGSKQDISKFVIWSVSNGFLASITNDLEDPGMLTGLGKGDVVVGARYGDQNFVSEIEIVSGALVEITVSSANPSGTCGIHEPQFTAKGTYSDNSEQDITALVTWASADPTLASVSNASETKGKVTTFKKGSTFIKASLFEPLTQKTITGQNNVTATDPVLTGYSISPNKNSVAIGEKVKLYAKDQFSCEIASPTDRTAVVLWESGNTDYLDFITATKGEASTYGDIAQQTVVEVTASFNGLSGKFDYPIRPKELASLVITSDNNISWLEVIATEQFRVTGIYSNGMTEDVTNPVGMENYLTNWSISQISMGSPPASIDNDSNKGVLLGIVEGTVDVKAEVTINGVKKWKYYRVDIVSRCIGGTRYGLYCWYQGPKGLSCDATCSLVGANHIPAGTINFIGTGGNGQNCSDTVSAMGISGTLNDNITLSQPSSGIGCAIYASAGLSIPKRITSQSTLSEDFNSAFKRICSCDQ